ncbi:hypothetical protein B6S12_10245 [Helicobacter valdiviensis]|uniref:Uncharacterized protein n=1 Tax=Helicobacter valdiviensis TaxID=1458358 RepID=A0A2W6NE48_9HELI|nr:hypothetical protein [Helicobacter valdiviensis]PZT47220.1 hypothetical protein B6S12_10245 [Helicobacter valdiviensis]
MLKFSKKNIIIILIVAFLISVMSNLYDYVNEALDYKNTKETKARENLNSLILWSNNEAKEELEYAKKLSKETYNQEKVTKEIIKNFEKIKASIESMRILSSYGTTKEDMELMRKAGHAIKKSSISIILHLLSREKTLIGHKTYFLFSRERFKAIEDFLFFLNTHLEDFLKKDINEFELAKLPYATMLIGYNRAFADMYLDELFEIPGCEFNNHKTIRILNGMSRNNFAVDGVLFFFNKELKKYTDDNLRKNFKELINIYQNFRLSPELISQLQTLQTKLKECEK